MPRFKTISQIPKILPYYHSLINKGAQYILFGSFIVLVLQTFIKVNSKNCNRNYNLKRKWLCFFILIILEYLMSCFIISSIAMFIASICLFFMMFQQFKFKSWLNNKKENENQVRNKQYLIILLVFISKILFSFLKKVLEYVPFEVRNNELKKQITVLKQLFQKTNYIQQQKLKQNIKSQKQPILANFILLDQQNDKKYNQQEIIDHPYVQKKTQNSEDLSSIIKPLAQIQTLLSPNEQAEIFQFGQMTRSPMWNQFISDRKQISNPIPEITQQPSGNGFCCDQMIQLTKKSFQFFREVIISKSFEGIEIVVKNSPIQKRKFLINYQVSILNQQIIELKLYQSSRFFRFESTQSMNNFIRYINDN